LQPFGAVVSVEAYLKGVFRVRRLALTAIAAVALLFPSTAAAGGWETTVEPAPGDFTLTSAQCPNLPPGTTIEGTGTGTSVTKERTDRRGITTVLNSTIIPGRATDQAGNRYRYLYSNQFAVSNSTAEPGTFTGKMVDLFVLHGDGPANLRNGFLARITTDFDVFTFESIFDFGDPINFETGEAVCDPL
jgi:hypothetical protein